MGRIFGFDIGTTSIGFAVIDHEPDVGQGTIRRLGVRIFPEARDPDGTPLNQTRRQKRLVRRQIRRRRARRRALNELLSEAGFLPPFGSAEWNAVMTTSPIVLRVRGLTEPLAPHELGRALYHLAHRRHYRERDLEDEPAEEAAGGGGEAPGKRRKPSRKPAGADAKEAEERSAREQTVDALRQSGQTLAQYLDQEVQKGADGTHVPRVRQRQRHALRTNVLDEFRRLCDAQAPYHPRLTEAPLRGNLEATIFAQKPVFWRTKTLGTCRLSPGAPLARRASWLSQQRRMLEKLNNLALVGGNERLLDAEERVAILEKLQVQARMSWAGVRAALRPLFAARGEAGGEKRLRFNLEDATDRADSAGLLGNMLEGKLVAILGDTWAAHPHRQAIRDRVPDMLWSADYAEIGTNRIAIRPEAERRQHRADAIRQFVAEFGVTEQQARSLADLTLPSGWEPFSTKALEAILPELERGERFGTLLNSLDPAWVAWRDRHFPNRDKPAGEILARLPSPASREEQERIAGIRNPTVVRVQNELRKVVNNLIGVYGRPDLIRVELAREIGLSKKQREERQSEIKANEARRKEAIKDLKAQGITDPSGDDIEKWLLWTECGCFDPYSGQAIGFDDLFGRGVFEVEHIWPRSRCFDDGMRNKTLCERSWNQRKGQRTPFQAFGNTDEWEAMAGRVWKMVGPRGMSAGKAKRFCRKGELDDSFVARQLNDTGYAARQAVAQLRRLWPDVGPTADVRVQVVTGKVTAKLRRLWRLNHILGDDGEKNRADHRHHAVDALVVACTHPGMTNRLSRYFQLRDEGAKEPRIEPPWEAIRNDTATAVDEIVVSHRVRRKLSGPLHKETIYGDTGEDATARGQTYRYFVARKPVKDLKKGDLVPNDPREGVRDPAIRALLCQWVIDHGGDLEKDDHREKGRDKKKDDGVKKALANGGPRLGVNGPEIHRVRVVFKQTMELMTQASTGYADVSNNHHIAIYRHPDGRAEFEVVSLVEAARRAARHEPIVRRTRDDGASFVYSLGPGETLCIPSGDHAGKRVVQGVWASGQVVLVDHRDATGTSVWRPRPTTILDLHATKISVDPIGNLRPTHT